jgi:hypothetical protein
LIQLLPHMTQAMDELPGVKGSPERFTLCVETDLCDVTHEADNP